MRRMFRQGHSASPLSPSSTGVRYIPRMPAKPPGHERRSFLTRLARFFNEGVMGLLALIALATALGPMVFDVSPSVERAFTVVEWVLVGMFAAEFFIEGAVAHDRRAWIRS